MIFKLENPVTRIILIRVRLRFESQRQRQRTLVCLNHDRVQGEPPCADQQQGEQGQAKREFDAEERAGQVAVQLVVPLVLCMLPALFVVLLGPALLQVSDVLKEL